MASGELAALVVFMDIRGFTTWSEKNEVFARLGEFAEQFMGLLRKHFPKRDFFLKGLGDGAMIVREISPDLTSGKARDELVKLLKIIGKMETEFAQMCQSFGERIGHAADLRLGWGVVRGAVQKVEGPDYVGSNINKSARLCDQARPFGIVIDQDDFPQLPPTPEMKFSPQTRKLIGIGEVQLWVTDPIATGFLTRERLRQHPEVHVAGQCIDTSKKKGLEILIARRAPGRRLLPGLYEGCGGQLAASETFTDGVARHFRLEMGIEVKVLEGLHCFYTIREPDHPLMPGIRFLCERVGDETPRSENHDDIRPVSEREFNNMPANLFVPGLKDEVSALLARYKKRR